MQTVLGPNGQERRLLPTLTYGGFGPLSFLPTLFDTSSARARGSPRVCHAGLRLTWQSEFSSAFKRRASSERGFVRFCAGLCVALCGFVRPKKQNRTKFFPRKCLIYKAKTTFAQKFVWLVRFFWRGGLRKRSRQRRRRRGGKCLT